MFHFGSAYCVADWWDRGIVFTLFLGRRFEISGRRFISEFPVENLTRSELPRTLNYDSIDNQIQKQFQLLSHHGLSWLKGDFSREPYIRHHVGPDLYRIRSE